MQNIQRGPWNSSPRGWKSPCDILNYEVTTVKFISAITFSSTAACEFCRHGYGDIRSLAMSTWGPWSCRVSIGAASLPLIRQQAWHLPDRLVCIFSVETSFGLQRASTSHEKAGGCRFWCYFCCTSILLMDVYRDRRWWQRWTHRAHLLTGLAHSRLSHQLVFRKWYLVNATQKICSWLHDQYANLASSLCVEHLAAELYFWGEGCTLHWALMKLNWVGLNPELKTVSLATVI